MRPAPWRTLPEAEEGGGSERTSPVLVSMHFLWGSLRRHPAVLLLSPVLGLLLAATFLFVVPPAHAAKASLVVPSDSSVDPTRAMATNVSLLQTDTLAMRTTAALGLAMSPGDFNKTVTIQAEANDLMTLTVTAPTDAEAVRRLEALTTQFLTFRADQLTFQSKVLVQGLRSRIAGLQAQVQVINDQLQGLTAADAKFQELVTQRASYQSSIQTLNQQVEDETLKSGAIVASGRVLDPATPVAGRALKTLALGLASGLIGGTALGWGTVMFFAIASDRLRRRTDIATVLGTPVGVSVRRVDPLPAALGVLPGFAGIQRARRRDQARLARALENELLAPGESSRLVVARADGRDDVSHAVALLARELRAAGRDVTVVDVTEHGSRVLRSSLRRTDPAAPQVLRPEGTPALASHADELEAVGTWDGVEGTEVPTLAEIVITLADLEPSVGAAHLRSWADRAVVSMTTGGASAERLRTVSDQVRAAGLDVRFAALLRTDRTDDSPFDPAVANETAPVQLLEVLAAAAPPAGRFQAR